MRNYLSLFIVLAFMMIQGAALAQEQPLKVTDMSKEQIQGLSYQDLLNLPLEDLIVVANKFGLSADEMLEYFLNKDVVAASKKSEKSMESPLSTTVISKEEIERSGAYNIPEALRLAPGVIVREKTPGNYDVHIRGNDNIPSNNILLYSENMLTLVMIDNRPVYNYSFGGTFWETLPIEVSDVERIEIIRGPSSALYGPNAVSGAINIITKKATEKKAQFFGDAMVGNNNSTIANASSTFGIGSKLLARVSGNYQRNGRFNTDYFYFGDGKYHNQYFFNTTKDKLGVPLEKDIYEKEPDSTQAGEKYGYNLQLSLPLNEKVNVDLSAGGQYSNVLTTPFGNHWNPLNTRISRTNYADLHAKFYGFEAQVNWMAGAQDYEHMVPGFNIDVQTVNSNLEYEYEYKNLTIRPGVSFQNCVYDDSHYVNEDNHEGYLNGICVLNTFAYALRADYTAFKKLRLIAALRQDHYNKPNDSYLTYQFVTSYKINDKNLVRAVVSRANRGPFMADMYSDYKWEVVPGYYDMKWSGNQNLKMPVMDMIEIGYRVKPIKNIQADFEFFQTTTSNYSWFLPDSLQYSVVPNANPPYYTVSHVDAWVNYHNFDLKVKQTGMTANIQFALNKNLTMNAFITYQETKLTDFYNKTTFQIIDELMTNAQNATFKASNTISKADEVDEIHKSTPSYYGGGSINYILKEKWNFNVSTYYYGKQTFQMNRSYNMYGTDNINPKFLMNCKASYQFYKNNKVFVNVRNLFDDRSNEFAFVDDIGAKYFIGMQLSF
jgi:iron complex outermembrane receptor protein